jgi:prepilin-type N-terminal cleavage/methylation domain-containing protein
VNTLLPNSFKKTIQQAHRGGFALIELIIVMVIIGIMMAVTIPLFRGSSPTKQRGEIIAKLNQISQHAWQNALETGRPQIVRFDIKAHTVVLTQQLEQTDVMGQLAEQPVAASSLPDKMEWPAAYSIESFYIENNEIGSEKTNMFFYVAPSGVAQRVIINFIDEKASEVSGNPVRVSLVLNPFYVQFKEYNEYQHP